MKQTHKAVLAVAAILVGFGVHVGTAEAATPPDSCFDFDSGTGTILQYYEYENNDNLNPACPKDVDIPAEIGGLPVEVIGNEAFRELGLTSVTMPNSVVAIVDGAFAGNLLATVTIPDSTTSVGEGAFSSNLLTSVTLGSSLTTIDSLAFMANQLTTVMVPNSVTTIGPFAFVANSSLTPQEVNPLLESGDPTQVQQVYDSVRLVKLFTLDPSNPNSLTDSIITEGMFFGMDLNANANMDDVLGGHLINPVEDEEETSSVGTDSIAGATLASTGSSWSLLLTLSLLIIAVGAVTSYRSALPR